MTDKRTTYFMYAAAAAGCLIAWFNGRLYWALLFAILMIALARQAD